MRRRLGACHADSNEEYLQKLKAIDSFDSKVKTNPTAQMSPYNVSCTLEALTRTPIFGSDNSHSLIQSPVQREEEKTPSDFYESFTFNSRPDESSQGLGASEEPPVSLEQLAVKTIIVGSKEVQRHAFVHALVPGEAEETATKSSLDLVVKVKSEEKRVLKYHFWIKDCDNDQEEVEKFKGIYKMYYNFVSSLIFMYSVSDHESFNLLKKSIEEIKKSVGIEGFKAILIGLVENDSQNTRQVSHQEGESLMQEEGFAAFIEADLNDLATKEKALSFLCDRAEVQAKRKKSNINLTPCAQNRSILIDLKDTLPKLFLKPSFKKISSGIIGDINIDIFDPEGEKIKIQDKIKDKIKYEYLPQEFFFALKGLN